MGGSTIQSAASRDDSLLRELLIAKLSGFAILRELPFEDCYG
jgi:hypothetical protein